MAFSGTFVKRFMLKSGLCDFHRSKGINPKAAVYSRFLCVGFSAFNYYYFTLSSPVCDFLEEDCCVTEPFLEVKSAQGGVRLKWLAISVSTLTEITHDGSF